MSWKAAESQKLSQYDVGVTTQNIPNIPTAKVGLSTKGASASEKACERLLAENFDFPYSDLNKIYILFKFWCAMKCPLLPGPFIRGLLGVFAFPDKMQTKSWEIRRMAFGWLFCCAFACFCRYKNFAEVMRNQ